MKKIVAIITTLLCSIALIFPISMTNVFAAHIDEQIENYQAELSNKESKESKESNKLSSLHRYLIYNGFSEDGNFSENELNSQQFHKIRCIEYVDIHKRKLTSIVELFVDEDPNSDFYCPATDSGIVYRYKKVENLTKKENCSSIYFVTHTSDGYKFLDKYRLYDNGERRLIDTNYIENYQNNILTNIFETDK